MRDITIFNISLNSSTCYDYSYELFTSRISMVSFYRNSFETLKCTDSQVLVAHTYNCSYSWAEIRRIVVQSQPGQIVRETLSQKTLHKNRAGGVAQGEGREFKPQYWKKKKLYRLKFDHLSLCETFLLCDFNCASSKICYLFQLFS
jgi:hypothetical protein